jgi:hypothetical protein
MKKDMLQKRESTPKAKRCNSESRRELFPKGLVLTSTYGRALSPMLSSTNGATTAFVPLTSRVFVHNQQDAYMLTLNTDTLVLLIF